MTSQTMGPEVYVIPIIVFVLVLGLLILWLWALIDCLKNEKSEGNDKVVWIIILVFLNWVGALLYLFVALPIRKKNESQGRLE